MGFSIRLPSLTRPEKRRVFVVSHTHWDREWYLPFEQFRARLVQMVDDLLDLLARDERFRYFTLDGQTVVLDDYLEARPERRADLRRLVSSGRLLVGPWFVMPDEFLVSGEALIRNLLLGRREANAFGASMPVGYAPDTFGHVSQLPQILRGFGIDNAVLWRGIDGDARGDQFLWRAPDGSEVLVHHLARGYFDAQSLPSDRSDLYQRLDEIRRGAERDSVTADCLLLMNGGDHAMAQRDLCDLLAAANEHFRDADFVHSTLPAYLDAVRASAQKHGVSWDVVQGELRSPARAPILAGVLSSRIWIKQRNAALQTLIERWAEPFAVFAGRGDLSRPLLKLAWRRLLLNHPHDSICGCSIDQVHDEMRTRFDRAEQLASEVADAALREIASRVTVDPAKLPASDASSKPAYLVVFNPTARPRTDLVKASVELAGAGEYPVVVGSDGSTLPAQTLSRHHDEAFSVTAPRGRFEGYLKLAGGGERWRVMIVEKALGVLARGTLPNLALGDYTLRPRVVPSVLDLDLWAASGGGHNYDAIARCVRELKRALRDQTIQTVRVRVHRQERIDLGVVVQDVPPFGYRVIQVRPGLAQGCPEGRNTPLAGPGVSSETIKTCDSALRIANQHLVVDVDPDDGTLSVLDRESGVTYAGFNRFVDFGEAGDEYTHCPPLADEVFDQPCQPPAIALVESGPARQTIQIDLEYEVPKSLSDDRLSRSEVLTQLKLSTRVSLVAGVRRVEIETTVENTARDHLLKARFPSGIRTSRSTAEGHFAVEARSIDQPLEATDWPEQPTPAVPHDGFVDVSDGERGLMLAAPGLPEVSVLRGEDGAVLDLTLLRSVGWLSRDDLLTRPGHAGPPLPTPGAQNLGHQVFRYALVPHRGDWTAAADESRAFAAPLRALAVEPAEVAGAMARSFLSVEPAGLVVSAVKPAENGEGFVVRLYNPLDRAVTGALTFATPPASAEAVDLAEESLGELDVDGSTVRLEISAGQIVSLRLRTGASGGSVA